MPTKICFFTREYAHDKMGKTGGIGVFVKQFTGQLKQHDFDITVFSFGTQAIRFNDEGITVVKIKDLSGINELIKAPLRRYKVPGYLTIKKVLEFCNRVYISFYLSLYVLKQKFDLIEFHDYGGDAPYFIGKLPKIVRCHGTALTLHQFMGYYKRQPDAHYESVFFKRFYKHIIAVSEFSAEMAMKAFHLKIKPTVIYNGIKVPEVVSQTQYLDSSTQAFSVFYFGSIRERKGIDIACETFNSVIEQFPEATFHVMGNNNNDHWNKVAVPILSEKALAQTTYHGMIPNAEVSQYLRTAHVVLFPSFGENFSVGLLEVMALGRLVVVSNIPAFQEIISHKQNGFIANEIKDYHIWIASIFDMTLDIDKVSKHAIQTVKHNFDIDTIIQQNINYYNSLL